MVYIFPGYLSRGTLNRKMAYEEAGGHVVKRNHVFGHLNFRRIDLLCCYDIRSASICYCTLSPPVKIDIPAQ